MANAIEAKLFLQWPIVAILRFQLVWRPSTAHILVFTSNRRILTQLSYRELNPILWYKDDRTSNRQYDIAKRKGHVETGDYIINLASNNRKRNLQHESEIE
jgi:pyruvate kinase